MTEHVNRAREEKPLHVIQPAGFEDVRCPENVQPDCWNGIPGSLLDICYRCGVVDVVDSLSNVFHTIEIENVAFDKLLIWAEVRRRRQIRYDHGIAVLAET